MEIVGYICVIIILCIYASIEKKYAKLSGRYALMSELLDWSKQQSIEVREAILKASEFVLRKGDRDGN